MDLLKAHGYAYYSILFLHMIKMYIKNFQMEIFVKRFQRKHLPGLRLTAHGSSQGEMVRRAQKNWFSVQAVSYQLYGHWQVIQFYWYSVYLAVKKRFDIVISTVLYYFAICMAFSQLSKFMECSTSFFLWFCQDKT